MAKRRTAAGDNGHDRSPHGGVLDPIALNRMREITANFTSARQEWLRRFAGGGDPRRSIDDECGYPQSLTIEDYRGMYDRNPVARRVVQVLPRECWQTFPEVRESEDSHEETEFERAVKGLDGQLQGEDSWFESHGGKTSLFFDVCRRADEACGIGSFGVVLVGLDDAKRRDGGYRNLSEPVAGFGEEHSVPVGREALGTNFDRTPGRWRLAVNAEEARGRRLLYLRPFDESAVAVSRFENNPTSPRYGRPVTYSIAVDGTPAGGGASASASGMPLGTVNVHWTRVVHAIDNPENSDVFSASRMHAPWNPLYNIAKVLGADAEGYWKNALTRLFFETHPQLGGDVEVDDDQLRDMMENLENGLQKYGRLSGMTAHPIAPAVVDPTPHIQANIDQICIMVPVPKRVFMGSERGELASAQDDAAWNDTLRGRQNGHCTVRIAVPLIDRLIAVGALPRPRRKYALAWPDLESLGEDAAATVANKWADALNKYVSGQLENIIDPMDFLTRLCRLGEDEAKAILTRTLRWLEFNKWSEMKLGEVELEPAGEWPGDVPVGAGEESGVAVGHVREPATAAVGGTPPADVPTAEEGGDDPESDPGGGRT